jgi:hypothetical protein
LPGDWAAHFLGGGRCAVVVTSRRLRRRWPAPPAGVAIRLPLCRRLGCCQDPRAMLISLSATQIRQTVQRHERSVGVAGHYLGVLHVTVFTVP